MRSMKEPIQFSMRQTAHSLTCSIMKKPHTRLDDCLRMLQACLRKRMSGQNAHTKSPLLTRARSTRSCSPTGWRRSRGTTTRRARPPFPPRCSPRPRPWEASGRCRTCPPGRCCSMPLAEIWRLIRCSALIWFYGWPRNLWYNLFPINLGYCNHS